PAEIAELHRRAARWLAEAGWLAEAVSHWSAAGEYDTAAHMIENSARGLLMRGEGAALLRLLDILPQNGRAHYPHLYLFEVEARFFRGELDAVERAITDIDRWLAEPDHQDAIVAGGVAAIKATRAAMRGEATEAIKQGQIALALLPEAEHVRRAG